MKGNNVIMYTFPKPNIKNKDETIKLKTIINYLAEGVKIGSMKISNTYRIRKYNYTNKGRPRPLRVIFEENKSTCGILTYLSSSSQCGT